MKIITLILCIIISGLAIMPCSDNDTCDNKETISQHEDSDSSPLAHNHGEDEGDLCTPFCNCACCGFMGFIVTMPSVHLMGGRVMMPTFISSYKSNFISAYFYSFWQPPKISIS